MNKKLSIWCLFKENWGHNLLYMLISVISTGVENFGAYALGLWIGYISEYAQNSSDPNAKSTFLLWTIIASVSQVLSLAIMLLHYWYKLILDVKNWILLSKLVTQKISNLEYQKFNQRYYGDYLSWYRNDLENIKSNFIDGLYGLNSYLFNILFAVIALFVANWIMGGVIVVIFILINLIPRLVRKPLQNISLNNSKTIEIIYGKLQKSLDLWTFFSFKNLRNKFFQQFTSGYKQLRKQNLKKEVLNMPYEALLSACFIIGIGLTFIIAIILKQHNWIQITGMTTTVILSHRVLSNGLGNVGLLLKLNSFQKIFDKIFDTPNSLIVTNNVVNNLLGFKKFNINNLSYQYQNDQEKVIEKFNYQFNRGKKYLIMAPSGYGKSTLVKIMAGLYKDYEGNVLWNNNQELKLINDQLLRKHISYVDNNNYILEDEGFETNITMWKEFDQERFNRIVKLLAINNLKGHFDHHKNALSEGQKQKIAMARMLYQNKPIIFLDEALDNIDQYYKEHLIKVFQNLASWKTLIVVTHNMKPEHRLIFDEVIYLDQLKE